MQRMVLLAFVGLLAVGCARRDKPIMAHDKPVDFWLTEVTKPDPKARKKAVTALSHVGTRHPAAIPAVTNALKDADASVRNEAVLSLLHIGSDARDALPALNETLQDKDSAVRTNAAKAIERISGKK